MRQLTVIFLVFLWAIGKGQNDGIRLEPPLERLRLVSTFGEIRSNHLHSGIDLSGFHRIGMPVRAAAQGYVSRIKVSADGYGNALYITHPNGLMTVYAHLDRFNPTIQRYVQEQQRKYQKFEITLYPKPDELKIQQGQIIGYVGNTGRSYAPHLHFEVRDALLDYPLNPLGFGLPIQDHIKPKIQKIAIYPAGAQTLINGQHRALILPASKHYLITVQGPFFTGIEAFDYVDQHPSRKGVYQVELYLNDQLILMYRFDRFFFQNSRDVNALIDYRNFYLHRWKIQQSYIRPNNKLCIYRVRKGNGVFDLKPGLYTLTYKVSDFYNNTTSYSFFVKVLPQTEKTITAAQHGKLLQWDRAFHLDTGNLSIDIPAFALYDTTYFTFKVFPNPFTGVFLSPIYAIHTELVPLKKPIVVRIRLKSVQLPEEKLLIVRLNRKNQPIPLSTTVSRTDSGILLKAKSYSFGRFTVTSDTVAPEIRLISKRLISNKVQYKLKITDELSGIDELQVLVNGRWHLYQYDAKTGTLTFEDYQIALRNQTIEVRAKDKRGNRATLRLE